MPDELLTQQTDDEYFTHAAQKVGATDMLSHKNGMTI